MLSVFMIVCLAMYPPVVWALRIRKIRATNVLENGTVNVSKTVSEPIFNERAMTSQSGITTIVFRSLLESWTYRQNGARQSHLQITATCSMFWSIAFTGLCWHPTQLALDMLADQNNLKSNEEEEGLQHSTIGLKWITDVDTWTRFCVHTHTPCMG